MHHLLGEASRSGASSAEGASHFSIKMCRKSTKPMSSNSTKEQQETPVHSSWFYSVLLLCVHLGHGVWSQYIQRKDDVETELEKEKIYQQQFNVRKRRRTSFLRIFPQSSSGRWLLPENVPSCCSTDLFPVSSRPRAAWREVMKTESGSGGDES